MVVPSSPSKGPENKLIHHNIYKENSTKSLIKLLSPSEFKWDLKGASWITEAQTFYFIGDDGSFCLVQVAYSNLTWPHTSYQIAASYYKQASSSEELVHKHDTQNFSSLRMKMKADKTSYVLPSSSVTMKRDGNGNDCLFHIHYASEDKMGIKVDLNFQAHSVPFELNDGKIYFGAAKKDGNIDSKFIPSGRCSGEISFDGKTIDFNGTGMCLRQFHGVRPYLATKRMSWAYFKEKTASPDLPSRSLFIMNAEASDAYGGEVVHYGYYFDGEKVKSITSKDNQIIHSKTTIDPVSGYEIPEDFDYRLKGVDIDGKDFDASITGRTINHMIRFEVLEQVPVILRKIFEKISSSRPCIYRCFNDEVEADVNGEKLVGYLFQDFSIILR